MTVNQLKTCQSQQLGKSCLYYTLFLEVFTCLFHPSRNGCGRIFRLHPANTNATQRFSLTERYLIWYKQQRKRQCLRRAGICEFCFPCGHNSCRVAAGTAPTSSIPNRGGTIMPDPKSMQKYCPWRLCFCISVYNFSLLLGGGLLCLIN